MSKELMTGSVIFAYRSLIVNTTRKDDSSSVRKLVKLVIDASGLNAEVCHERVWGYPFLNVFSKDKISNNTHFKYLSLTHTKGSVGCAFSSTPVGIDVEHKDRSAEKIIHKVVTPSEYQLIDGLGLPVSTPLLCFVGKEAAIKGFGVGMKYGFKPFLFESLIIKDGIKLIKVISSVQGPHPHKEGLLKFFLFDNFIWAICTLSETLQVDWQCREL